MNKVHIKIGTTEFSVEGESEFIAKEREYFWQHISRIFQFDSGVSTQIPKKVSLEEAEERPVAAGTFQSVTSDSKDTKMSAAVFLKEKQFTSAAEVVMGAAYYLTCMKQIEIFNAGDIQAVIDEAQIARPSNIWSNIRSNIKRGWLQVMEETKKGRKAYKLQEAGKRWCEQYKVRSEPEIKGSSQGSDEVLLVASDFSKLSVGEFSMAKYCDPMKAEKFREQLLMVMYIFIKEKNIQFFSTAGLISLFKQIFHVSITQRKMRYALHHGEWAYRSKMEKKEIYYTLSDEGLREAERLIARYKAGKGGK